MKLQTKQLEALLFYFNEEMSKKRLAEMLGQSLAELEESVAELKEHQEGGGIALIDTNTTLSLGTDPGVSKLIEEIEGTEEVRELSKAALETLSIVLYEGPVSRAEVDTIRGVNSLYSLRNLLVRGLIGRRNVEGRVVYEPTSDTLAFLGISAQTDLPDYQEVKQKIEQISAGFGETPEEEKQTQNS